MSEAGRGASANPPKFCKFGGQAGRKRETGGGYSPEHYQARRGAFFALFAGSGSPPPASARSAPRSPESAQGANSPNALARGGGKQSRAAQQGKRFSARPSAFGGMRRAGRARGRRPGSPPVRRRDIFRYQLLAKNIRARRNLSPPPFAPRTAPRRKTD